MAEKKNVKLSTIKYIIENNLSIHFGYCRFKLNSKNIEKIDYLLGKGYTNYSIYGDLRPVKNILFRYKHLKQYKIINRPNEHKNLPKYY